MTAKLPSYLYKYRAFDKNTIDNLINETLWFSKIDNLNDPAEFNFNKDSADKTNHENFLKNIGRKNNMKNFFMSNMTRWLERKKLYLENGKKQLLTLFEFYKKTLEHYCLIFSCSENKEIRKGRDYNILLWSHYADSHKGICIEYKTDNKYKTCNELFISIKKEEKLLLKKIDYKEKSPYILNKEGEIDFNEIPFIKFKQWKYENEWRLFILNKEQNIKNNIPMQECFGGISSIIFGCKMSQKDKDFIIKIFDNKAGKPSFKEAIFDETENYLNIRNYKQ